jgi:DNA polymerase I
VRVIIDIECNRLENPDKIWVIVCKDIDTGKLYIFRKVTDDPSIFKEFCNNVGYFIGHNILGYDVPIINKLLGIHISATKCFDTFIASKFVNYSLDGHSIEDYGERYGLPKGKFNDWSKYSQEMEDYCIRDVEINERIYHDISFICNDLEWYKSFQSEQDFQLVANDLHDNGFHFNLPGANALLARVNKELIQLDEKIHAQIPSRLKLIREIHPTLTQHGTIHRKDFRWVDDGDLSEFNGGPFCRCTWQSFNPSSHKQIIDVLHTAQWKPTDRTQSYIDKQREAFKTKEITKRGLDIGNGIDYDKYSWKINETNLLTLPSNAPSSAKSLARRILIESRRRTLTEWLGLVREDNRIHGQFYSIGAWTHRMAHQKPNTANIPNSTDTQGKARPYGAEMRALWCAPKNRLLVGVDAESIQLRIFAHYIDDKEFTDALVQGRKETQTDPHSLNQRILGSVCKSRASAKRFIYALLLGAGLNKLAQILGCSLREAKEALERLLRHYDGFAKLKRYTIPKDAKQGWFSGLDGRRVKILGDNYSQRRHLAMSGYLQNGEAVIMKHATLLWYDKLTELYRAKTLLFGNWLILFMMNGRQNVRMT